LWGCQTGIAAYFYLELNFRVPAEFEIAIGIGIEIGSGIIRLTPMSIAISIPIPILDHNFHETRKLRWLLMTIQSRGANDD